MSATDVRPSRHFRLLLAYDGTHYHGWQRQPEQTTVQGCLERALERLTGEALSVVGASRTDAGVHALAQLASFSTTARLPAAAYRRGLNALLPGDIRVIEAAETGARFHAIRAARGKRYRYVLADRPLANPFWGRYVWHLPSPLDAAAMHRAAQALVGQHDFASFVTGPPQTNSTVRTIFECTVRRGAAGELGSLWTAEGTPAEGLVVLEVAGDGFLYNMVRTIVGTLREVGLGRRAEDWVRQVLAAQNRTAAGMTAPPQGLVLVAIDYQDCPPAEGVCQSECEWPTSSPA